MTEQPRVLCVDDEPALLEGLQLHLRRRFKVKLATSGAEGLEAISKEGGFAAVVSDMRMPGMNGAEFLKRVRATTPDTVRLLLTGQADMTSAIAAVNEGQIFRFLTKPCAPPALLQALESATEQHRLVTAERELLEKTLRGTVKVLADVLALASPLAFGKVTRTKLLLETLLREVAPAELWKAEAACLFSMLGAVHLSEATLERWYKNEPLDAHERAQVDGLPQAAEGFLQQIPRLEPVREVMAAVGKPGAAPAAMPVAARAVRIALDFDALHGRGDAPTLALETLKSRAGQYDAQLLSALEKHVQVSGGPKVRELNVRELKAGMLLAEDLRLKNGVLLVPRGFEVTAALQARLAAMSEGAVREPVRALLKTEAR